MKSNTETKWVINPIREGDASESPATNRVEIRVTTREEVLEQAKPKHAVIEKAGLLIEQLHDRVLINKSTRSVPTAIRRYWMLKTLREWRCEPLQRMILPREIVECHDTVDFHTLTAANPDGPFCEIIEEVRQ